MTNQRGFAPILILLVGVLLGAGLLLVYQNTKKGNGQLSTPPNEQITPSPSATPSPTPLPDEDPKSEVKKKTLVSTEGWKIVTLNGVSFKIPADNSLRTYAATEYADIISYYEHEGKKYESLTPIRVEQYKGGSRREQFFSRYQSKKAECHEIYEEGDYGGVRALLIAADWGWCQGGAGGYVAVIGDKLVILNYAQYRYETKEILDNEIKNTIISTLRKAE